MPVGELKAHAVGPLPQRGTAWALDRLAEMLVLRAVDDVRAFTIVADFIEGRPKNQRTSRWTSVLANGSAGKLQ
jgi:hypothetical protein